MLHYRPHETKSLSFLQSRPAERISRGNVLNYELATMRFPITRTHEFAQFQGCRRVITMCVLERSKRASFVHKILDFGQDALGDLARQSHKWQTAEHIAHLTEARFLMDPGKIARISTNDI